MWQKPAAVALGVFLALVCAEGSTRVALRLRGTPYSGWRAQTYLAQELAVGRGSLLGGSQGQSDSQGAFFLHPYFGWEANLYHGRVEMALRAFRSGRIADDYCVVVVGGSVAGLLADEQEGAPDVLIEEISRSPALNGRRVRLFNQGRGAFKQPQQVFLLHWLFDLGILPDAVINIDGFNELAIANQNLEFSTHPLFPSFPQWGPRLRSALAIGDPGAYSAIQLARQEVVNSAELALEFGLPNSAIFGRWAVERVRKAKARWQRLARESFDALNTQADRPIPAVLGPRFEGDSEQALELSIQTWRESSLDLEALCHRRGIAYVHVLQPTLHDRGSKPLTPEELEKGRAIAAWRKGVTYGYSRLRAAGQLLTEAGVRFEDASQVFAQVPETLYYDPCHFNREGNVLLAKAVASAFRTRILGQ